MFLIESNAIAAVFKDVLRFVLFLFFLYILWKNTQNLEIPQLLWYNEIKTLGGYYEQTNY